MNKVFLAGRLTKKPELKQTKSNKNVCEFSIAIGRGIEEDGVEKVDFVKCICWNKLAENLCKYQDKGDFILVDGSIRVENYTDKNGDNRYTTYVLVDNIEFAPRKKEQQEKSVDNWEASKNIEIDSAELPFY